MYAAQKKPVLEHRPDLLGWIAFICTGCGEAVAIIPGGATVARCKRCKGAERRIHDLAQPCADCWDASDEARALIKREGLYRKSRFGV